jgi:EKC/KEOPS complex subunit CGI121/TPRKB
MEELHVEHLSDSHTLLASLFRDVINSEFLQRQLLDGNTEFEYACIDASMVRPTAISREA